MKINTETIATISLTVKHKETEIIAHLEAKQAQMEAKIDAYIITRTVTLQSKLEDINWEVRTSLFLTYMRKRQS